MLSGGPGAPPRAGSTSWSGSWSTHGRAETEAQIGDLEVVPRRRIEYRGVSLEEMDVDAVIARRPEVAVVDELAHTNVPGVSHRKRWEDVDASYSTTAST